LILKSKTKSVAIEAPPDVVFNFLSDLANWPKWAIVNVKAVSSGKDDWWDMTTPMGQAKLRIRPNKALGILDHDFNAPDASWTVPARVVPNGSGSEFMITFFQPPAFTEEFFEQQIALVDKELAKLKELVESASSV